MGSGRLGRWIFVAFVLVLALYSMYPPANVLIRVDEGYDKIAETPQEAWP